MHLLSPRTAAFYNEEESSGAHNPKIFFCLNKSLHLFETHCAFLKGVLTFFYFVKVTKSSHHLSHDRASKGHGSIPGLRSQTDLHRIFTVVKRLGTRVNTRVVYALPVTFPLYPTKFPRSTSATQAISPRY